MECTVSWTGAALTRSAMGFVAETGSGHILAMDGAPDPAKPENGGQNLAPRPMELPAPPAIAVGTAVSNILLAGQLRLFYDARLPPLPAQDYEVMKLPFGN